MSPNYVQKFYSHECQPSGHQLSHQTIAKLWHLMVGQGLRARMSAVVQLWSKTTTANLWSMTHKKIVCVITDGTNGQDLCFVRFYDHNLMTIHFEVDLNQDFVFEARSSVFYVLSGSYGQSIGIKFGDKLKAKDFKIIVMERRIKQLEQLFERKLSSDLPSDANLKIWGSDRISLPIRSHTLPKTSLKPKTRSSIAASRPIIGLQSDPTLDTMVEKGLTRLMKNIKLIDSSLNQLISDVRKTRHTSVIKKSPKIDQSVDICLSSVAESGKTMVTSVVSDENQSITGSNLGKDIAVTNRRPISKNFQRDVSLPESVDDVSEKLMVKTAVNGHELATDEHLDPIRNTVEIGEDIASEDNDNHSDGGSDGNHEDLMEEFMDNTDKLVSDDHSGKSEDISEVGADNTIEGNDNLLEGGSNGNVKVLNSSELKEVALEMFNDLMAISADNGDHLTTNDSADQVSGVDEDNVHNDRKIVDSKTYKQMRETMNAGTSGVFIRKESKRSKSPEKSGSKYGFCWC